MHNTRDAASNWALFNICHRQLDVKSWLQLWPSKTGEGHGAKCVSAVLTKPLVIGSSTEIQYAATVTQVLRPFPEAVFQNEPQRVLYHDSLYILSPYKVLKQSTKARSATFCPLLWLRIGTSRLNPPATPDDMCSDPYACINSILFPCRLAQLGAIEDIQGMPLQKSSQNPSSPFHIISCCSEGCRVEG